ncbi:MAG: (d)CMP kinase [Tissierellia bacterium]|nr:(d)CMP kinase [Tissierellia bacterium]
MYKSIAIDGPSGAGKSTISKLLADKIGFEYLDTGAMYRAFTLYYLENELDIKDEDLINKNIDKINLEIKNGSFFLNGVNVDKKIRSQEVTKNVSLVSSYKLVRQYLVEEQRRISKKANIVVDGRDIGSSVLPDASIKFYLTAQAAIRAKRRLDQLNDPSLSFDDILKDIIRRDEYDSNREISPLIKVDDAIEIDSSKLDIHQVIDIMVKYLEERNVI